MGKPNKTADLRFAKFGAISFTQTCKVNDFIDHLQKGQLAGTRCKKCGQHFFPPRADCSSCLSSEMEWRTIGGPGRLVSFSTLQYAPCGFEQDVPYTLAVLECGDFQVFGRLDSALASDEIRIGMELVPKVIELPGGQLSYVFSKP